MNTFSRHDLEIEPSSRRRDIAWEEVDCPLCASDSCVPLFESADYARRGEGLRFLIVRCTDCGLCYTNPRPGIVYFERREKEIVVAKPKSPSIWQQWLRWNAASPICGKAPQAQSRLLDIGRNFDERLELDFKALGWNVAHLEADSQFDLEADLGYRKRLTGEPFDLIVLRDALQRFGQPNECLRNLYGLLAPSGTLRLTVPNLDSLAYRWFGPSWQGLEVPECLVHFSPVTIRSMLQRAGFRVTGIGMRRRYQLIRKSARRAPRWCSHILRRKPLAVAASWAGYLIGKSEELVVTATK